MKKVYNVSYDLNKKGKDYQGLYNELKSKQEWYHLLDSTWLLCTSESAAQLWERLRSHIDNDDYIFIAEITNNYEGWLPNSAWQWIKSRLPLFVN